MEPVYGITPRSPTCTGTTPRSPTCTGTTCRPLTTPFLANFGGIKVPPRPVRPAVVTCPGKGDGDIGDIGGLSVVFKVFIPS